MNIEAKYLNIKWKNKNEIEKVTEHFLTEKLEYIDDNTYFLQLYTYVKIDNLFAQIAFQIDDETITPAILLNDGSKQALKKIIDPETNKIWWVEEGEWSNKGKFYESLFINHIGDTKICFGDTIIDINVKALSLTEEDVEIMLNDFRNELWKLIYNSKSYTNIAKKSYSFGVTEQYKQVLEEYINNINKILQRPKVSLKEYFIKENIKKLTPTIKTFMEYMSDPSKQYYTSKSKLENYNIPDNQYIYWTFECVKYILHNNINYQKYIRASTNKKIDEFKSKIDEINGVLNSNKVLVNKNIFHRDAKVLRNERDELIKSINSNTLKMKQYKKYTLNIYSIGEYRGEKYFDAIMNSSDNIIFRLYNEQLSHVMKNKHLGEYCIECEEPELYKLKYAFINLTITEFTENSCTNSIVNGIPYIQTTTTNNITTECMCKIKIVCVDMDNNEYIKYRCNIDTSYGKVKKLDKYLCYLTIPKQYTELYQKISKIDTWFLINVKIDYTIPYKISKIISIIPLSYNNKIKELEAKEEEYEKNNWYRDIDLNNQIDRDAINYLKKEADIMSRNYKNMNSEYSKLLDEKYLVKLYNRMVKLDTVFKNLKVKSSSIFPNSMTFIQNYFYSNAFNHFNNLLELQNIDIKQLYAIKLFEQNISVTNIHEIYERWCFIIVVNMLVQYFHFKPKDTNWINSLLEHILSNKTKNTLIELFNQELECTINVWYEKEFISKKCPDIVLEIMYEYMEPYKIVLDAKFHEEADIKYLITLLYYKKDYAEQNSVFLQDDKDYDAFYNYYFKDNKNENKYTEKNIDYFNKVFILHPDLKALSRNKIIINNQKWGEYSYYGEGVLFDDDQYIDDIKKNDDIMANHRYGAIAINPKNYSYQTMLQRLIGMCLQYYPYNMSQKIPDKWICIACGNVNHESNQTTNEKTVSLNDDSIIDDDIELQTRINLKHKECKYCGNIVVYTNCFACKVKLIKNGIFWTYHNSSEDSIYNIKCPNCNSFFTEEQSELYHKMKIIKKRNYSARKS